MIVIGNWKMNGNVALLERFCTFGGPVRDASVSVGLLLPYPYIAMAEALMPNIDIGAQDVYPEDGGAVTGAVSGRMLKDLGCKWVCVGHSERRALFNEGSDWVATKCHYVASKGMRPIVCVGENASQRTRGEAKAVVLNQLKPVFEAAVLPKDLIIAYEPVWAIGSGNSASADEVEEMHRCISDYTINYLAKGSSVPIIYGGSVNPDNAKSMAKIKGVDGFLVGGASLSPELFYKVVNLCSSYCSSSM